jgi:hypothetical protein
MILVRELITKWFSRIFYSFFSKEESCYPKSLEDKTFLTIPKGSVAEASAKLKTEGFRYGNCIALQEMHKKFQNRPMGMTS